MRLRAHVRTTLAEHVRPLLTSGAPDRAVGTSKTMRSLARIAGAAPRAEGPFVPRTLSRDDLREIVARVGHSTRPRAPSCPASPRGGPRQLYAGALVAEAALDLLQVEQLDICPWALREGLILRRLDHLDRADPRPRRRQPGVDRSEPARRGGAQWPHDDPGRPVDRLALPRQRRDRLRAGGAARLRRVEVMVWTDPVTRRRARCGRCRELHALPIVSVHAPTLLLTQRVWGTDPWGKVDRSIDLALEVGAGTVVLHPPFRWQREYAAGFVDGVARREHESGIRLAVENMYPLAHGAPRGHGLPPALGPGATSPTTT